MKRREVDNDTAGVSKRLKTEEIKSLEEEIAQLGKETSAITEPKLDLKIDAKESEQQLAKAPFFDRKLVASNPNKKSRLGFNFIEKGTLADESEQIRTRSELEKLKLEIFFASKNSGIEDELDLVSDNCLPHGPIPDTEWWDLPFLMTEDFSTLNEPMVEELVTNLIHHPVLIFPPNQDSSTVRPLMLTLKERKKARRLRRLQAQKDKMEKIKLGLLPSEQPKARIANMMNIYGEEAVLDPTKIEKLVQNQVQSRLETHLKNNEERKLTEEEKRQKKINKYKEDVSNGVTVAVFRVKDLSHPSHKFKVDKNAKHNYLYGAGVLFHDLNVIVVAGGPKGIQRYKNLMLKRIDWTEHNGSNTCDFIWEGVLNEIDFSSFKFYTCTSEDECKKILGSGSSHLWDLAKNYERAK